MTNARCRASFAQKTMSRRFILEISLADDFQSHGAVQIDVERLVSDTHGTTTQLHGSAVGVGSYLVVTQALRACRRNFLLFPYRIQ